MLLSWKWLVVIFRTSWRVVNPRGECDRAVIAKPWLVCQFCAFQPRWQTHRFTALTTPFRLTAHVPSWSVGLFAHIFKASRDKRTQVCVNTVKIRPQQCWQTLSGDRDAQSRKCPSAEFTIDPAWFPCELDKTSQFPCRWTSRWFCNCQGSGETILKEFHDIMHGHSI